MKVIKNNFENPIEATCQECNTLFSFVLPEVEIIEWEEESGIVNVRRKGLFKKEYWCYIHKKKRAVIKCPSCGNSIRVDGYMPQKLATETIGEKILDRKDLHYIIP